MVRIGILGASLSAELLLKSHSFKRIYKPKPANPKLRIKGIRQPQLCKEAGLKKCVKILAIAEPINKPPVAPTNANAEKNALWPGGACSDKITTLPGYSPPTANP